MSTSKSSIVCIRDLATDRYVNDEEEASLSRTPTYFYQDYVDDAYFTLQSFDKEKYLSTESGNRIKCNKTEADEWELFKYETVGQGPQHKLVCKRDGDRDRWYQIDDRIEHYQLKDVGNDRFEIASPYDISSDWAVVFSYENDSDEEVELTMETSHGYTREASSTFATNTELEMEIENKLIASVSASFGVSTETALSTVHEQSRTIEETIAVPARTKVVIRQLQSVVELDGEGETETFDFNEYRRETSEL